MASDSKKVAKEIYDNLVSLAKKDSATTRRSAGDPANRKQYGSDSKNVEKRATQMYKKYTESLSSLYKSSAQVNKELEHFNKNVKDSNGRIEASIRAQSKLMQRFIQNDKISNEAQDRLTKKLKQITEESSLFSKSIVKNVETMRDFEEVIERSGDFMESYTKTIKDNNKQQISQMKSSKDVKAALSELATTLYTGEELNTELNRIKSAESKQLKEMAKKYDKMSEDMNKFRSSVNSAANRATMMGEAQTKLADATVTFGGFFGPMGENIGKAVAGKLGVVTAISLFTHALFDAYGEMKSVAKAGFGGEYFAGDNAFEKYMMGPMMFGGKAALKLQMSTEAFVEMLNQNKNLVAKMGVGGFTDTVNGYQDQLMMLGATTEQAASGIAGMMSNAQLMGVDIDNRERLNTAINTQIAAFSTLKATTGESIEQFNETNRSIADNSDQIKRSMRLGKDQRAVILAEIAAERARLATMGLAAEQQRKVIEQTQKLLGNNVEDRFSQAAKAAQAATMMGDSEMASRLYATIIKGNRATSGERSQLSSDLMSLSSGLQGMAGGSLGAENLVNKLMTDLAPMLDGTYLEAERSKQTKQLTDGQVAQAEALARIPQEMVNLITGVEGFKKMASNSSLTVGILGSILAILAGRKLFGPVFGKLLRKFKVFDKMKNIFGKMPGAKFLDKLKTPKPGGGFLSKLTSGAANIGSKVAGFMGGSSLIEATTKKAGDLGRKAGSFVSKLPGAGIASSLMDKAGAIGPKGLLKGAGKLALKGMKFLGPLGMLASGVIDAGMGVANAGEIFGTENTTLGQKAAAGAGGLIDGLTFGLVDGKSAAQGIYDFFGGGDTATPKKEESIVQKEKKQEEQKRKAEEDSTVFEQMKDQLSKSNEELKKMTEMNQRTYELLFDLLSNGRIRDMNQPGSGVYLPGYLGRAGR